MKKQLLVFLLTICCLPVFAQVPTSGLMAYYPFCGNANDMSGHGHNLTVSGGATLTTDRYGNYNSAYQLDGVNSLLYNDTVFNLSTNFTYSEWMLADTTQDGIALYNGNSNSNGVGIVFDNGAAVIGQKITMLAGGTCFCIASTASLHQWHHIVLTDSSSHFKLYVDTILVGTSTTTIINPAGKFHIGIDYTNGTNPFKGKIDDIAIYDRALNLSEIKQLFEKCGKVSLQPSPITCHTGDNISFTTATTIPSAIYQWQADAGMGYVDLTNAGPYSGVYTATLAISGTPISLNNVYYRCNIINPMCCSDTTQSAKLTVLPPNGVKTVDNDHTITIYPNPSNGNITINMNYSYKIHTYHYEVYDLLGQKIINKTINEKVSYLKINKDGIYVIKFYDESGLIGLQKVVIN